MKSPVITTLACLALWGCKPSVEHKWQSGDYSVSTTPKADDAVFGYKLSSGGGFELVGGKVVGVGENDFCIVCKRDAGDKVLYYAITKSASGQCGTVSGPMGQADFEQLRSRNNHPNFTWEES